MTIRCRLGDCSDKLYSWICSSIATVEETDICSWFDKINLQIYDIWIGSAWCAQFYPKRCTSGHGVRIDHMDQCVIIRSDATFYSCIVSADAVWCKKYFRIELIWIYARLEPDITTTGFDEWITKWSTSSSCSAWSWCIIIDTASAVTIDTYKIYSAGKYISTERCF